MSPIAMCMRTFEHNHGSFIDVACGIYVLKLQISETPIKYLFVRWQIVRILSILPSFHRDADCDKLTIIYFFPTVGEFVKQMCYKYTRRANENLDVVSAK